MFIYSHLSPLHFPFHVSPYAHSILHHLIYLLSRTMFFMCGFHWITIRGRRASSSEAPLLVVAPHSTFFDPIVTVVCDLPSVVSRVENLNIPVIGGEQNNYNLWKAWCFLVTWQVFISLKEIFTQWSFGVPLIFLKISFWSVSCLWKSLTKHCNCSAIHISGAVVS